MIIKSAMFNVPMYKFKARNHKLIKEYFQDELIANLPPKPNVDNLKLYSDYFGGIKTLDRSFYDLYQDDLQAFHIKAGFNTKINWANKIHAWYNIGYEGHMQEEHDHIGGFPSTIFSAIHYVVFDKNEHTPTQFLNPLHSIFWGATQNTFFSKDLPSDWQNRTLVPDVEEGDMIFFPSFVRHSVPMQTSSMLRATVALNINTHEAPNNAI